MTNAESQHHLAERLQTTKQDIQPNAPFNQVAVAHLLVDVLRHLVRNTPPQPDTCACGTPLQTCTSCGDERCPSCDPEDDL